MKWKVSVRSKWWKAGSKTAATVSSFGAPAAILGAVAHAPTLSLGPQNIMTGRIHQGLILPGSKVPLA